MTTSFAMGIIAALLLTGILVYCVFFSTRRKVRKPNLDRIKQSPAPHTYFDKYAKRSDLLKADYPTQSESAANLTPHSHPAEK